MSKKPVIRIAVTGAGGQIAYQLLFRIASGEMLGKEVPIALSLLEVPEAKETLEGVMLELIDCAFPLLREITITVDPLEAFRGADIALLVGASPRTAGMERKDLLKKNGQIFIQQGQALNLVADPNCLVLVVGNPCNTNALILLKQAPKLQPKRVFAMTRLDENRAKAQLALKAGKGVGTVKRMTIWGNHSSTQVPDFTQALIGGKPALQVIPDRSYLEGEFIKTVQNRGARVIAARGKSSAASAAHAIIESIQALYLPTEERDWFSIGLYTPGNPYGIDSDLIFSFPCRSKGNGEVEIVSNISIDPFILQRMKESEKELIEERSGAS